MPWVDDNLCTGCGVCIAECPVGAIERNDVGSAVIRDSACIRCGKCHEVCPQEAVRHDSERIGQEVAANLQWVRELLKNFEAPEEQSAFIGRMVRFFKKERRVNEQTLAALGTVGANAQEDLTIAINGLSEDRGASTTKGR